MIIHTTEEKLKKNGWNRVDSELTYYEVWTKRFCDDKDEVHIEVDVMYQPSRRRIEKYTLSTLNDLDDIKMVMEGVKGLDISEEEMKEYDFRQLKEGMRKYDIKTLKKAIDELTEGVENS